MQHEQVYKFRCFADALIFPLVMIFGCVSRCHLRSWVNRMTWQTTVLWSWNRMVAWEPLARWTLKLHDLISLVVPIGTLGFSILVTWHEAVLAWFCPVQPANYLQRFLATALDVQHVPVCLWCSLNRTTSQSMTHGVFWCQRFFAEARESRVPCP